MMIYPPIAKLVEKTGSRYVLVIEAAKRARQLSEGAEPLAKCDSNKEVSIATNEIFEGKLEAFKAPVQESDECDCCEHSENEENAAETTGTDTAEESADITEEESDTL